jgi:nicotinamide-nucleotide amidase
MSATQLVADLRLKGWTLATAESLTAGMVCSTIGDVPGCSDVLMGAVVAYAAAVKTEVLHVPSLATGLVSRDVAESMAAGVRALLGADVGIATTGVAGPEPHDGAPVGSVWISVITPDITVSHHRAFSGDRGAIRAQACDEAILLALEALEG